MVLAELRKNKLGNIIKLLMLTNQNYNAFQSFTFGQKSV